jgi:uncharacterized protein
MALFGLFSSPQGDLRDALALIGEGKRAAAFRKLSRAAQAGIAEAEYQVARSYLEGAGAPGSVLEAKRWLEKSAEQNYVPAQAMLAAFYVQGVPIDSPDAAPGLLAGTLSANLFGRASVQSPPDFDLAAQWAGRAAEGGSHEAQALLAYLKLSGPPHLRDEQGSDALYAQSAAGKCPQGLLGHAVALLKRAKSNAQYAETAVFLEEAAEAGLGTAQYLLAALYDQGNGVAADPAKAADLMRQAAEKHVRSAMTRYGVFLLNGKGVEADPVMAESWLRRAAIAGDGDAAAMVGQIYTRGTASLPANLTEAALWLQRAAEAGHANAARALGAMHMTGEGVRKDPAEAAKWFRRAAEAGLVQARYDMAAMMLTRVASPEDARDTAAWFHAEAEKGDAVAAYNYGVCLAEGLGVAQNAAEAARYLRRAADSVGNAQYWYGRVLREGVGIERNDEEARAWFLKAAETGIADGQVALADMYVNGLGGPRDHRAALEWFQRAANQGHIGAMFALGALYGGGHQVMWDRRLAQRWFKAAAERGHPQAAMLLGRYLARGLGGERDKAQARRWFERALAAGIKDAEADLAELPVPEAASEGSGGSEHQAG